MYPALPQELGRIRKISQNQNTVEINRKIIHPRRNRNFQTLRVHFDIPQSPTTTTQNPQTTTRISFQDNPHTFEERHARLSEPLEPVQRQAPLSEPTYNFYPTLPQELSRIRNISQNQNTVEINRKVIHPRRNSNFQTLRVHFDIPQSPTTTTSENPNSTLPETPPLLSQRSTSSIPSDYLGSTPTSEQIRENPFNPPPPI